MVFQDRDQIAEMLGQNDISHQPFLASDYSKRLLNAVTSLTAEMSQASSRDQLLALVATWTPSIVPADRASVAFPIDGDYLEILALEGNKAIPMGRAIPIINTPTGMAFLQRQVIRVDDTSKRSDVVCQALAGKGLMSCLSAPMISQGQAIGTLNVGHWKKRVYTLEHEALFLHVAGVVAAHLTLLDSFFATQEKLESMVAARTQELEAQKGLLEASLDKERELNGLQRQFVSMVSHEFRTPLAIIDGVAQRVLRRLDRLKPEALKESQQKVRGAVARLTELMESVLSAARLEEGQIAFEPKVCPLVGLITELHGSYSELNKNHEIILDIDKLPNKIVADSKLLRQVVSNLLSNAIKYSREGTPVWINGHLEERDELVIAVRDKGVGIPEAELENLFERFFRASTSTGIAGSGIGLNLAQHFVDMHGGRIDVESTVGIGSTFTIHLPFIEPAAETMANMD